MRGGLDEAEFLIRGASRVGPYLTCRRGRDFERANRDWCRDVMEVLRARQAAGGGPDYRFPAFPKIFCKNSLGKCAPSAYAAAMDSEDSRRVLDPAQDGAALKALTHPCASPCSDCSGSTARPPPASSRSGRGVSASTSYHLRVLAKYAFVAEADHRDSRERRWKSVHDVSSWSNEAMHASPGGSVILSVLHRRQIEHLQQSLDRHEADLDSGRLGEEWQEPSGLSDLMPRLTPSPSPSCGRCSARRRPS